MVDEVFHRHGAIDVAGVESEKDPCERSKCAHQARLERDWSFDPIDVDWHSQDDAASRHIGKVRASFW